MMELVKKVAQRTKRVINVSLSPRAERVVGRIKLETGVTQLAFVERLLEWYAAQDERVRAMILSPYPTVRQGLAKLLLAEMASNPTKDLDALPAFDALIDHNFETKSSADSGQRSPHSTTSADPSPKPRR